MVKPTRDVCWPTHQSIVVKISLHQTIRYYLHSRGYTPAERLRNCQSTMEYTLIFWSVECWSHSGKSIHSKVHYYVPNNCINFQEKNVLPWNSKNYLWLLWNFYVKTKQDGNEQWNFFRVKILGVFSGVAPLQKYAEVWSEL